MIVCQENVYHTQEFQKRAYNKNVKLKSYIPGDKVWLNNKYLKIKQKQKLKTKFFGLFQFLHPVGKEVYKLEFPKKWKILNVFHMSLLKQKTTKKEQWTKT